MFKTPKEINEQGTIFAEYQYPQIMGGDGLHLTPDDEFYDLIVANHGPLIKFKRPRKPKDTELTMWEWDGVDSWVEVPKPEPEQSE